MTISDANKLLALAKANYSYAFKTMSKQEKVMLVQSWAFALQDIPADIVMLAFMQLLSISKWLPTVAEIREQVQSLYYEANSTTYFDTMKPKNPRIEAAREYIASKTGTIRGDSKPKLSLDAILEGSYGLALGSGQMGFSQLDSSMDYLPEPDYEEEPET